MHRPGYRVTLILVSLTQLEIFWVTSRLYGKALFQISGSEKGWNRSGKRCLCFLPLNYRKPIEIWWKWLIFTLLAPNGHFKSMKPGYNDLWHWELSSGDSLNEFHGVTIFSVVTPGAQRGPSSPKIAKKHPKYDGNLGFSHVIEMIYQVSIINWSVCILTSSKLCLRCISTTIWS